MMDEQEKPLLYFQTLGRRYKRLTPYPKPRPYDRAKDRGAFGNPVEMQAVFDSRRDYLITDPPYESHEEIGNDSRDLGLVLADFPGLHDFVFEMETVRHKSLDRLNLLNQTRQELVKVARQLQKVSGEQPKLQSQIRALEIQIDRINEDATGEVTVAALMRKFELTRSGVTKHLRQLRDDGEIAESGARIFKGEELKKIRAKLSNAPRLSRGKKRKTKS
jgi:biotin operon repressor